MSLSLLAIFSLLEAGMYFATGKPGRNTKMNVPQRLRFAALAFGFGLGSALVMVPAAEASVIFTLGNNPQPDEQNIFFAAPETGTTIFGQVGQSVGLAVRIDSFFGQTLNQNSQGQAFISNDAGGPLNNINVTLPGLLFADFILNLRNLNGHAIIDVRDNNDHFSDFTLSGGPGQNFLTITIDPIQFAAGLRIANVGVISPDGFDVFAQPRVSGVCDPGIEGCGLVPIQVPEPASLALFGTALAGLGLIRRRRRKM
jgi:hypothetical protein